MSFDYKVLIKRIVQSNLIVKELKDQLGVLYAPTFETYDAPKILEFVNANLVTNRIKKKYEQPIAEVKPSEPSEEEIKQLIQQRTKKIN